MSDLVDALREAAEPYNDANVVSMILKEAADEIERLQALIDQHNARMDAECKKYNTPDGLCDFVKESLGAECCAKCPRRYKIGEK